MTHRVIQWSTGNVGQYTLRAIVGHPLLELAGVWVHSDAKVGKDAAELCGLDTPTGVLATNDADTLLASDADVVCYTATGDLRPQEAVDDMCRFLRAGKHVVSTSVVSLLYPPKAATGWVRQLRQACEEGGTACFTSGIDPGFANDLLPLVVTGFAERIDSVRIQENLDYSTYMQPEVLFDTMGFGQALDAKSMMMMPGALTFAWGGTIRLLAEGLGLTLDRIAEVHERKPATKRLDIQGHVVEPGTTAAMRFEIQGIVGGKPVLVVEHVTRLDDELAPEWPQGNGSYRVLVKGDPGMRCDYEFWDEHGDHAVGGVLLTATRIVNAIPAVCEAPPGLLSALDLPLVTGRGLLRA
jgi:4-hydroxy-tetrahydrodipicolinate reductase